MCAGLLRSWVLHTTCKGTGLTILRSGWIAKWCSRRCLNGSNCAHCVLIDLLGAYSERQLIDNNICSLVCSLKPSFLFSLSPSFKPSKLWVSDHIILPLYTPLCLSASISACISACTAAVICMEVHSLSTSQFCAHRDCLLDLIKGFGSPLLCHVADRFPNSPRLFYSAKKCQVSLRVSEYLSLLPCWTLFCGDKWGNASTWRFLKRNPCARGFLGCSRAAHRETESGDFIGVICFLVMAFAALW